jgi:hypothetical protein
MNCASARQRLLTLPDPAAVPGGVAGHLSACPTCQAWHRLLVQVEGVVAALPVPASDPGRKQQVIDQFRSATPRKSKSAVIIRPAAPVSPAPAPSSARARFARLWPMGLVAAAVLVGGLSWVILSGKPDGPGPVAHAGPDPMLERVVAAKIRIDTADSAASRLQHWSELAGEIHEQAKALARVTPTEMDSLARLYERVVGDEALVATARTLSADERQAVLAKYAEKLVTAEEEATRLSAVAPPLSDQSLRRIAAAANASRTKLTLLQQGRDI